MVDAAREFRVTLFAWGAPETAEARALRIAVFVEEQNVPLAEEFDATDKVAAHALVRDSEGRAVATGRLFADAADPGCAHIGRMATRREARGRGAGAAALRALIEEARRRGFHRLVLSAQTQATGFYERHGFRAFGPEYLDVNIPHRDMERFLEAARPEGTASGA